MNKNEQRVKVQNLNGKYRLKAPAYKIMNVFTLMNVQVWKGVGWIIVT
jgi:hypothetical protein